MSPQNRVSSITMPAPTPVPLHMPRGPYSMPLAVNPFSILRGLVRVPPRAGSLPVSLSPPCSLPRLPANASLALGLWVSLIRRRLPQPENEVTLAYTPTKQPHGHETDARWPQLWYAAGELRALPCSRLLTVLSMGGTGATHSRGASGSSPPGPMVSAKLGEHPESRPLPLQKWGCQYGPCKFYQNKMSVY